jgi:hypothetical protein
MLERRSPVGHSLQIVGRRKSLDVRNALKATVGRQSVVRRDGPEADSRAEKAGADSHPPGLYGLILENGAESFRTQSIKR